VNESYSSKLSAFEILIVYNVPLEHPLLQYPVKLIPVTTPPPLLGLILHPVLLTKLPLTYSLHPAYPLIASFLITCPPLNVNVITSLDIMLDAKLTTMSKSTID
jgi:hypothetical protein